MYHLPKLVFLCIFSWCFAQKFYDITLDQVNLLNSSYVPGYYNISVLRISKFNRTTFVYNLEADILIDLNEEVFFEVEIYRSRLNNNQYTKSPARVPKLSYCEFLNTHYKKILMEGLKDTSNFPQLKPNENGCPQKKVRHEYLSEM